MAILLLRVMAKTLTVTDRNHSNTRKVGPSMYVLFAAPVISLAAIFAITLSDHFATPQIDV